MKRILIVFPTAWDFRQLDACQARWRDRYELIFEEPKDEDCPWDLDPVEFLTGEDGKSARYGIINLAASDAADRDHLLEAIVARLGFVIVSL